MKWFLTYYFELNIKQAQVCFSGFTFNFFITLLTSNNIRLRTTQSNSRPPNQRPLTTLKSDIAITAF